MQEFEQEIENVLRSHDKSFADLQRYIKNRRRSMREEKAKVKEDLADLLKVNKTRALSVYLNPHTGEEVRTRGGNHKTLNAWRVQWGREEVSTWLQEMID